MSVLIHDMEMPQSCYDCDFAYQDQDSEHNVYWSCAAVHKSACMYERRDDCPLVPVPPHGDLIDRDALIDKVIAKYLEHERIGQLVFAAAEIKQDICDLISDAPTIIPAEESE